jgi:hypothetical protein
MTLENGNDLEIIGLDEKIVDPAISRMVNSFEEAYDNLMNALISWELTPRDFSIKLDDHENYPFEQSFDEVVYSVGQWVLSLRELVKGHYSSYSPTMKVKDLKRVISNLDDNTQIVIGNPDGWYNNIESYEFPDGENYIALTFNMGESCNTRQF